MPYYDPDFNALECDDIDELLFQVRAVATDIDAKGFGLSKDPVELARDVYGALVMMKNRQESWREAMQRKEKRHDRRQ